MRTFKHGDPDPGDVNVIHTAHGTTFYRNHRNRWCQDKHADDPRAVNDPMHLGASWEFLTDRCGPLTAEA